MILLKDTTFFRRKFRFSFIDKNKYSIKNCKNWLDTQGMELQSIKKNHPILLKTFFVFSVFKDALRIHFQPKF